jgi:hypothetical protein
MTVFVRGFVPFSVTYLKQFIMLAGIAQRRVHSESVDV